MYSWNCAVTPESTGSRPSVKRLLVPSVKLSTVGGRASPVAGPIIWNSLPDNVISALLISVNLPSASENISVPGLVP